MKNNTKRIFLIVLACMIPTSVMGYFENRLLCQIENNTVQVSIDTQTVSDNAVYCFSILQRLARKIVVIEADIQRAQRYVLQGSDDDARYREQVIVDLETTSEPYYSLRDLVTQSMQNYETELFFSTKNLVKLYLKQEYDTLNERLQQAYLLKERIVSLGNTQQFIFVRNKIEERETELMILRSIRNATSFDTLIPSLKNYFGYTESGITSDSL